MEKKDCETQEVEIQPFYVEFGIRDSKLFWVKKQNGGGTYFIFQDGPIPA